MWRPHVQKSSSNIQHSVVSITQNSRGCASLMTAGAPCVIVMSGCASGKQYSTFVQTVVKSGSKINMFCISIIIRAVHHLTYESLMIFVYLGHNYSTNDAAKVCPQSESQN